MASFRRVYEKLVKCFSSSEIAAMFYACLLYTSLVMVTNQDGLGTESFPEDTFYPAHNKMLKALANEGVIFDDILIDRTFPEDNAPTRKPGTGMLTAYMNGDYDLEGSYVIGDRLSDAMLARNLGAKAIILHEDDEETRAGIISEGLTDTVVMVTPHWDDIIPVLQGGKRLSLIHILCGRRRGGTLGRR